MKTNVKRASQLGQQLRQLEIRGDFSGRHQQLTLELSGEIFFGGRYQRADGRMIKNRQLALESWIGISED